MSPRSYRSPARDASTSETRRRILDAARRLLAEPGEATLTVEAVAARADVARMTVYNQFGNRNGLVEAVSDDLAERGGLGRLPEAFTAPDARTGLAILVAIFTGFWASETDVIRRLRSLTGSVRDQRRRQALAVLIRRHAAENGRPAPADLEAATDLLLALTSFETYETLSHDRDEAAVARILAFAVNRLLGV